MVAITAEGKRVRNGRDLNKDIKNIRVLKEKKKSISSENYREKKSIRTTCGIIRSSICNTGSFPLIHFFLNHSERR